MQAHHVLPILTQAVVRATVCEWFDKQENIKHIIILKELQYL